jgi:cytochrome c peroxidase
MSYITPIAALISCSVAAAAAVGSLAATAVGSRAATAAGAACPGYSTCPVIAYPAVFLEPPGRAVLAGIDAGEAKAVKATAGNGINFGQLVSLLGEALVYDRSLSVRGSQACVSCHGEATGFAGGIAAFARAGGVFPGDVAWRTGPRAPQSLAYAAYAPVLHYRARTQDFAGGNFWDSRATGLITGSAAVDQAMVPLTSPFEMALPDVACAVWHVGRAPYGALFGKVWGLESLAIAWPADTASVCARPNDGGADRAPLHLSPSARARAVLSARQVAQTIETFEASSLASPFSAKYDAVRAGKASFTPAEARGFALFTGRGKCSACHIATGSPVVFTAYTSANIGVPRNAELPFLNENVPDAAGYVANPAGGAFIDEGLGGFLASGADSNPQWQAQAGRFMGAFQVPTLRNVALRARPGFARSYTHNGYFADLKMLVHFLNTRDVLPRCGAGGEVGVKCWPAPEQPMNVNVTLTGSLGLSDAEENDLITFLQALDDG